jgi:hypothetical protein
MSRPFSSSADLKRRRLINFAWIAGLTIVVVGLMILQQIEILYVLCTLGVTALLVVVALADLDPKSRSESALGDDSAALGSTVPRTARAADRARR